MLSKGSPRQCRAKAEVAPATCMVQRKAAQIHSTSRWQRPSPQRFPLAPSDLYIINGALFHKAGLTMGERMFEGLWEVLGYNQYSVRTEPCYVKLDCRNWDSPVRFWFDFYSPEIHEEESGLLLRNLK